jgi:hypothetical protein
MLVADSWLDVRDHRNMDNRLPVAAWLVLCQLDEEDKKGWLFVEVLVIFLLSFIFWTGVPFMDRAKYMRGLHVHSSYILIILNHFPINYLDRSQYRIH